MVKWNIFSVCLQLAEVKAVCFSLPGTYMDYLEVFSSFVYLNLRNQRFTVVYNLQVTLPVTNVLSLDSRRPKPV